MHSYLCLSKVRNKYTGNLLGESIFYQNNKNITHSLVHMSAVVLFKEFFLKALGIEKCLLAGIKAVTIIKLDRQSCGKSD